MFQIGDETTIARAGKTILRWEKFVDKTKRQLMALARMMVWWIGAERSAWLLYKGETWWVSLIIDTTIVSFSLSGWFTLRVLLNVILLAMAHYCARMADAMRPRAPLDMPYSTRMAFTDAIALSLYQIPLYVLLSGLLGGNWDAIGFASLLYLATNCALGWAYGKTLNWTRML